MNKGLTLMTEEVRVYKITGENLPKFLHGGICFADERNRLYFIDINPEEPSN